MLKREGRQQKPTPNLLQRDESRRVGGADSGAAVSHGSVGDGELAQVVAHHLGLDVDVVEHLAVVHRDLGVNHLGHDEHVAEVGLDHSGLIENAALCENNHEYKEQRQLVF